MMQQLVILGASAYPEIGEIIRDINQEYGKYYVVGILDDNKELHGTEVEGVKVKGPLLEALNYSDDVQFVLGIGSYKTRITRYYILKKLGLPDSRFVTLIHPQAKIFSSAKVSHGCIIHAGVVVFNDAIVEPFTLILPNTIIGARNLVGRGALVTSLVSTTTDVKIGAFSFIGTTSAIAERVEIGPGAMIAMGTKVYQDIPHGAVVFGNPHQFINRVDVPDEIIHEWNQLKIEYLKNR